MKRESNALFGYLSLFTSLGTLLCCALPSLLVLLGMGATVASILAESPWLVELSRRKGWVFAIAGAMIAGNFVYTYAVAPRLRAQGAGCAADAPDACETATVASRTVLWISAAIYAAGGFSAYLLGPLLMRFAS